MIMCGVTGWVDFGQDPLSQRPVLEAMTATMIRRGPDAGGVWCSFRAAIGHRRLSVIDIEGGAQPMRAPGEQDVVLTFSGEIYNFSELRHKLEAHGQVFRTRSDTEVLLRSYFQWGAECPPKLNGTFAFAAWDGRSQELLARDRLGAKPPAVRWLVGGPESAASLDATGREMIGPPRRAPDVRPVLLIALNQVRTRSAAVRENVPSQASRRPGTRIASAPQPAAGALARQWRRPGR